jgi:O-antigen/teichoic acid export membrane protein
MSCVGAERDDSLQPGRQETSEERADRNLIELPQELRVIQTGVQIVFAFLLGLAFTSRFPTLDAMERYTYVVTLLLAVASSAILATPVALHRALFHRREKARIVALSVRLAEVGLVFLVLALSGATLLLMDVVLGLRAAVVITAATVAMFAGLWFVLPPSVSHVRQRKTIGCVRCQVGQPPS